MALLIDGMILLLLAGTLGYAFLVDRRVRTLMEALRELQPMVGKFSAAVDRSEHSLSALKSATSQVNDAARAVREEAAETAAAAPVQNEAQPAAPAAPRAGSTTVAGKSDLVRSFFESARKREV
ncbi:flagellar motor switch protein [Profundibacterium mesophilum]|uniref:Flagellar motor switch protein n=1 Tax=Profundibacterium mesophilum KAUST100406-0324 TaxID=1037889 RepID=A0A921NPQ3_9RHOB|nr:flagellar motor switch protein [Profundibacterium mesophilum]KAF0674627.1 hypothetical protein PMES_03009 [Profundibacterium mesophilum KAUST100406-0324]